MLSLPTESFRVKAAAALAALYAVCLLLPAAAFAIADGRMAPPCLIDELATLSMHDHGVVPVPSEATHHHGGAPETHVEAIPHHHGDGGHVHDAKAPEGSDSGKSRPGECCGLFPMVALAGKLCPAPAPSRLTSIVIPEMTDAMSGRGPDRIIRPPIA